MPSRGAASAKPWLSGEARPTHCVSAAAVKASVKFAAAADVLAAKDAGSEITA